MESETEEDGVSTYKNKYRQLKSRLKYLIYEHECFENDIQKAQAKLLQLSRDKSFLLDQLMRYEAVVLSGAEEETDYSSGDEALPPSSTLQPTETEKTDSGSKSDVLDHSAKPASLPSSVQASQLTKQGVAKTTSLLQAVATNASSKTSAAKTGGVRKTKASTKVSAVAAAKITKAVARARQNPQNVPPASPLIVSLPLDGTSLGGRSKQPQAPPTKLQAPPTKPLHLSTLTSMSSTAAILASIPVPPKPPTKVITAAARPSGKGLSVITATRHSGRSSSSSSSSSSDSEDSRSESSSSSSSKEEPMEAGGPVPIVHSVPIPAGGPQLVRPKAILSPVKAPPQLIPVAPASSSSSSSTITHVPLLSPLTTSPGTQSQATRFLWSNRPTSSSDGQTTPNAGFTSIAPPLPSPTSLNKPFLGSAFQLVTSPPGSAPLQRPPSLQDLSSGEIGRPHPPS